LDVSLTRLFPIRERANLNFRVDFFNMSNSVVLGNPQGTLTPGDNGLSNGATNFGQITGTSNTERQIQFSMKLAF
jgi:hypothetical protein